jgi:hypothetical protein
LAHLLLRDAVDLLQTNKTLFGATHLLQDGCIHAEVPQRDGSLLLHRDQGQIDSQAGRQLQQVLGLSEVAQKKFVECRQDCVESRERVTLKRRE